MKSVGWVFAGKIAGRGMSVIKMVVLARLLDPRDFGLFGIVMLAIATLQTFSRTGFNAALIQNQENTDDYLDTAWTIQAIRGLVLAGVLFAAAPLVSAFFDEPRATALLRVMCISVAVGGFRNIGIIYFRKELKFHKQVLFNTGSAVISLIVGVILAYHLRSVWALVWAGLANGISTCLLSYLLHPYRPRLRLEPHKAKQLFNFGGWVLLSGILIFINQNGDDAFVGKVLGAASLGVYQLAYRLSNAPATELTHVISSVTFPAYSQIQNDIERFRRAYLRVLKLTMLLAAPIAAGIAAVAPTFVIVFLGRRWLSAIVPLQILSVFGLERAFNATAGPVFYASNNPSVSARIPILRLVGIVTLIWPLTQWFGISGTSLTAVLSSIPVCIAAVWFLMHILDMKPTQFALVLWKPVISSIVMFAVVRGMGMATPQTFIWFVVQVITGMAVYFILIMSLSKNKVLMDLFSLLRNFKPGPASMPNG
ncbi:MAG: lipopolysaccharide biosynthesis protein [Candidatus Brocadiia bacterium]